MCAPLERACCPPHTVKVRRVAAEYRGAPSETLPCTLTHSTPPGTISHFYGGRFFEFEVANAKLCVRVPSALDRSVGKTAPIMYSRGGVFSFQCGAVMAKQEVDRLDAARLAKLADIRRQQARVAEEAKKRFDRARPVSARGPSAEEEKRRANLGLLAKQAADLLQKSKPVRRPSSAPSWRVAPVQNSSDFARIADVIPTSGRRHDDPGRSARQDGASKGAERARATAVRLGGDAEQRAWAAQNLKARDGRPRPRPDKEAIYGALPLRRCSAVENCLQWNPDARTGHSQQPAQPGARRKKDPFRGIDRAELEKAHAVLHEHFTTRFAEVRRGFRLLDADHSGTLSREEMRQLLGLFNLQLKPAILEAFIDLADYDDSGTISYAEFAQIISAEDIHVLKEQLTTSAAPARLQPGRAVVPETLLPAKKSEPKPKLAQQRPQTSRLPKTKPWPAPLPNGCSGRWGTVP